MKVKYLIEELSKYDGEMEAVAYNHYADQYSKVEYASPAYVEPDQLSGDNIKWFAFNYSGHTDNVLVIE